MKWTLEEITQFNKLVEMSGSPRQMDRINSRLDMPKFIQKVGRDKCNAMWDHLNRGGALKASE